MCRKSMCARKNWSSKGPLNWLEFLESEPLLFNIQDTSRVEYKCNLAQLPR
jgi:hypothetical protein